VVVYLPRLTLIDDRVFAGNSVLKSRSEITVVSRAHLPAAPDTMYAVNLRVWLAIWISLIVVVVVPWGTFEPHAHWERMAWIPFISPPVELEDVVGNLLFYLPYGILVGQQTAESRGAIVLATGCATVLSLATEFTQIFSDSRFPSMTDVACNVIGAGIGASWAIHRRTRR
jgi:glycopeptide antibiotics resistance protein